MTVMESQSLHWDDLHEGERATLEFTVDDQEMAQFAAISGDYNPLHLNDEFARKKGFDGRVVYGALLAAKVSQLIGMHLPGRDSLWAGLSLEFRRPLYIGQTAEIQANVTCLSEATSMVFLEFAIRVGESVIATGKAEVKFVRP